jgi:hypothetical protein
MGEVSKHRSREPMSAFGSKAENICSRRVFPVLSCFGGGAHCIEQAARAIAGRLIPQLPARRRFHRTLLISAGPSSWARAAVPHRAVRMAGFDGASAKIRTTIDTLGLKMRLAIAISN